MKSTTLLLVEDSEADQFLFKLMLDDHFPQINLLQAMDGQEALELLKSHSDTVTHVFLDINMPNFNGYDFLDAAEQIVRDNDISVIMLTSSNHEKDKEKVSQYDIVKEYYEKPLDFNCIERLIETGS